jgi:hypothetical protein
MRAVDSLPVPADQPKPLRVLNQCLSQKLELANEVTRFLKHYNCHLLAVNLDGRRPLLRVERLGGPLLAEVARGVMLLRPAPGVSYCRAYLLGCEVEWLCPSEVLH